MSKAASHCCLCGLLCAYEPDTLSPSNGDSLNCPRRHAWISQQRLTSQGSGHSWEERLSQMAALFEPHRQSLIWLDSVDVATVRAAVAVARTTGATVHVGGSTGAELTHRVLTSEGWFGSTLAEVVNHADLIVTLGEGVLRETPLLVERFFQPAIAAGRARWTHIADGPQSAAELGANQVLSWPRPTWYSQLTELLWTLQPNRGYVNLAAESLQRLCHDLQQARYAVWMWETDEFCDDLDELIVRRLLGISRQLSIQKRCSLISLDSNVGRVTALESLLWLTGCHSTARYVDGNWKSAPRCVDYTLNDWQAAFDSILLVRSLPGLQPLPNLRADQYVLPSCTPALGALNAARVTRVAAVSEDCSGHVFRGDRAISLYCQPSDVGLPSSAAGQRDKVNSPSGLPTAAEVLDRLCGILHPQEAFHAS